MTRLTEKAALEGRAAGLDAALSAAIKQLPYSNKASIEHRVAQQLASSSPPPSARPTSPYSAKLPPAETSVQTALKMATTAAAEASLPQLASRQATAAWKTPAKPGNYISFFFFHADLHINCNGEIAGGDFGSTFLKKHCWFFVCSRILINLASYAH
jgi:hypothetical protein